MNKIRKMIKNERGMTLIELLAVIVIIAIIAAIAIPAIGNIITNQKEKAILADASTILSGAKLAFADGACGTDNSCSNIELAGFIDELKTPLVEGDKVDKTTSGYDITYSALGQINNAKYKEGITGNKISSDKLNKNMGN
ncbi:prepilin-type N-terminal cleavage/methylation domain-containing protein [Viridibacillus arvi]|uniref:prepilin-type N-terminal cleavage/methylation domain-containing protein n=1 Tax=Viridibacillus arvi TaxID=263475 RepID=UPI00369EE616